MTLLYLYAQKILLLLRDECFTVVVHFFSFRLSVLSFSPAEMSQLVFEKGKSEMKLPVFVSGYLFYNYMYWLRLFVDFGLNIFQANWCFHPFSYLTE